MSNLEMIEKSFGVTFYRGRSDFGLGSVPSEVDILSRRLLETGGYERVRYPFSLQESVRAVPKSLFDVALLLAIEEDTTHLVEVCEADQRLERVRLRKERLLSRLRDEMDGKNWQTRRGEPRMVMESFIEKEYSLTWRALNRALKEEIGLFVDRYHFGWNLDRSDKIARAWEEYSQKEKAFRDVKFLKARNIRNLK